MGARRWPMRSSPRPLAARLQLKWPNDLWLADGAGRWRKLGGILVETVATGGGRACVVGVGLNVRPRADVQRPGQWLCLRAGTRPAADAPALLPAWRCRCCTPASFRTGRPGTVCNAFARRDLLCGRAVSTTLADLPQGVADGVDASGALRLRHAGGVALVHSGEVSVRPARRRRPDAAHLGAAAAAGQCRLLRLDPGLAGPGAAAAQRRSASPSGWPRRSGRS
jgi:biotin-(acetyl-CoA carboxylase) ligase